MTDFWEDLYASVSPLAWADEENDYALRKLCQALGYPFEEISALVRDTDDGKIGWSILLDPTRVPDAYLPWLQQIAGVPKIQGESPAQARDRLSNVHKGWRRGTPQAIIDRAAELGFTSFILLERYTSPWNVRFVIPGDEYTAERVADLASLLPAGITWTYAFWLGMTYETAEATFPTYADLLAGTASYTDLSG